MRAQASEPIGLSVAFWQRQDVFDALCARDIGHVFRLVRQYGGMSQTRIGIAVNLSQGKVSAIMNGSAQVTALEVFERVADGLAMPDPARIALGLAPRSSTTASPSRDTTLLPPWAVTSPPVDSPRMGPPTVDLVRSGEDEDTMRRRDFVGLTGAALFSAVLQPAPTSRPTDGIEDLAAALVDYPAATEQPIDITGLARGVAQAKSTYQACHYAEVTAMLPGLLRSARIACTSATGDARHRAHVLSAEAHHVAASILLKQDDKGLAWLAADRSTQAAHASENPLMIGSSARIITRALMDGKHHRAAINTASAAAQRMDTDLTRPNDNDLSIYGSLLLSGAVAAAKTGNRHTAAELLDEADQAGRRLGHDGNHMWTAFGPNNVLCHRVNIALTMGDAGTAIDFARQVDINALPINERKATLLLDTARAFLTWNKHDQALYVLRAASEIAPEEITARPATLRLVRDLLATAPITVRRDAREYAESLGVSA
ncbi:helix-turn-helix transcriptional regulator [Sphaerisporangium flaviroseum]|uniref:Helix-turn-helix transcriptional regulator n=1 Tax=Sphaerisporangium flaviroseum TaxID=509199 RepID=A0ABP7HHR8_9ACTN